MVGKDKNISIGLEYRLDTLEKSFSKIEGTMRRQQSKLRKVGKQLSIAISLPVISGIGLAVKEFAEFEQSMAKVQAVSGATASEFENLNALALELGRSTIFTAQQVSDLELQYSKLGFSGDEIEKITKATLDLALVTGEDLARSAQVGGSTLRGFNLEASEMPRVVDVMAKAFTSSALDLEKFQVSVSKIAPIAAATGRSIEEVAAMQSVLADTGIEASIIGTSLRKIFGDLAKEGLSYKDAMDMIRKSTNPVVTATKLFDIRAAAAAVSLAFQDEKLKRLLDTYKNAGGTTEELSDIMNDTLMVDLKELQSAVQGLGIKFGEVFAPAIRKVTDALTTFAQKMGDIPKPIKAMLAVLSGLLVIIPPIIAVLGQLSLVLLGLGTTISAGLLVVAPYVAAIVALGVGFSSLVILLYKTKDGYSKLQPHVEGVARAEDRHLRFSKLLNAELPKTKKALEQIKKKYSKLADKLKAANREKIKAIKLSKLAQIEAIKEAAAKDVTSGAYKWTGQSGNLAYAKQLKVTGLEKTLSKTELILQRYKDIDKQLEEQMAKIDAKIAAFDIVTPTGDDDDDDDEDKKKPKVILPWSVADLDELKESMNALDELKATEFIAANGWTFYSEEMLTALTKTEDVIDKTVEKMEEFRTAINETLVDGVRDATYNIADMFGTMLTDDSFTGKDFGRGMLEMVADFLQKFGGLLIAWGLNFKLFKESVKSGQAVPAIIAGAAMIAAGAAIKGALKGGIGASVSVQPTYSGSNGGTNYAANDYSSEVMIRGREMIIVQSRERSFRR